jgi:hypothetical protein
MLIGRHSVVLDACVLFPAFQRSVLLYMADEMLFQPRWSAKIQEECSRSICQKVPGIDPLKIERTMAQMNNAFPEALIDVDDRLVGALELPDQNDRHVLAAAIIGKCDAIVTANIRDFPASILSRYELDIVHPDNLIVSMIDLAPDRAMAALNAHLASMTKPPITAEDYLTAFQNKGLTQTYQRLLIYAHLLKR